MRLKDMNIYQIVYSFSSPSIFFEKDPMMRGVNKKILEDTSKEIFNPELSKEGLRQRQLNITYTASFFCIFGGLIFIIFGPLLSVLSLFEILGKYFFIVSFYLLGIGIHIALFRGCRASLDEIKFMKNPEKFRLNKRCYIRWYDFLGGIPLALVMYYT